MTKKTKSIHKLGNAIRALKGSDWRAPQKMAKARAKRWFERCVQAGYITPSLWKLPTT